MTAVQACAVAAAVLLLLAAAHPFGTYPLSLLAIRRLRRPAAPVPPGGDASALSVAILICAYNEEACLPRKLESLRALKARHPGLRVLVYSDGSTDRTDVILAAAGGTVEAVLGRGRRGKSVGINAMMRRVADVDLVVLNDANVTLDPESVANLRRRFLDPSVGLVNGHVTRRTTGAASASVATTAAYYDREQRLKVLESELDTTVMSDGSLYAIRRRLFRELDPDAMEDTFTSLSILCDGHRLVQAPDVRGEETDDTPPLRELRRKRRIACRAFRCHLRLWPRLRRLPPLRLYMYLSHKLLRWLSGWLAAGAALLLLAATAASSPATALALAAAAVAGSVAGAAALRNRPYGLPARAAAIAGAFAYTSLGVLDALRGRTYTTWTPVRTAA